jgi:DNA-binding transcriptional ArsR family regulator
LAWLGRLGIAGIEPLALALGLHERTVYSHVERLARAGLVARVRGTEGEGGVVVITRAGARAALESGATGIVSPRSTAPTSARHGRAVSWVAATAALRGWGWHRPAELRGDARWHLRRDDGARHLPHLGLVFGGGRYAIEVELHAKAPRRVAAILRAYRTLIDREALTAVRYVVDRPDVAALIERERRRAFLGTSLSIGSLETVIERTRERGRREIT